MRFSNIFLRLYVHKYLKLLITDFVKYNCESCLSIYKCMYIIYKWGNVCGK